MFSLFKIWYALICKKVLIWKFSYLLNLSCDIFMFNFLKNAQNKFQKLYCIEDKCVFIRKFMAPIKDKFQHLFLTIRTLVTWLKSTLLLKIKCSDTHMYMKMECLQTNKTQHCLENENAWEAGGVRERVWH